MNKLFLPILAFCFLTTSFTIPAATAAEQTTGDAMSTKPVEPFGLGEPSTAYAKYFIGNSHLKPLLNEGLHIANVTFEPGCRNNWHVHKAVKGGGQVLLCTAGRGWYQEWGQPARELKPGDVVNIPAGVKHWHGAAKDSWFVHIAIAVPGDGTSNDWLEPVTDAEYSKLP